MSFKLDTEKFKLVGGSVITDFVNTVSNRISNPKRGIRDYKDFFRREKLSDYKDLVAWGWYAKLIDDSEAGKLLELAAGGPQTAEKILNRARTLRESVYRLLKSVIEGWEPEARDLEKLNSELDIARKHQKISYSKNGYAFKWSQKENSLDSMLWIIAESAAEILVNEDLTRLRQCGDNECNWMFIDTSRNRSRHWCDMKECGNLAKVRRFRQKQQ